MESELIAFKNTCSKAEWLRNLLAELPTSAHFPTTMPIHNNYQAIIVRARSKICMRYNIIKQLLESGIVSPDFVKSVLSLADPLSKPLNN